jgi:tetratricopeptide (TPR) repeat protein
MVTDTPDNLFDADGSTEDSGEDADEVAEDAPVVEGDGSAQASRWPAIFSAEARDLLRQAETTAVRAYFTYDWHSPDRPLWRETLQLARASRDRAPERLEPVRFLAEIYLITEWYARAWQTWQDYIALGGVLDSSALTQLSIAGKNIGFLSYQQENLPRAEQFYAHVFARNPDDDEALLWLGRLNFEMQDPEAALPFWQEAVRRDLRAPHARTARYFLQRTQSQVSYGVAASDAFYQGFEAYQAGDLETAFNAFVRAINLNDRYVDAVLLAGRVNLERGNLEQALRFYRRANELAADVLAADVDSDSETANIETDDLAVEIEALVVDYFRLSEVDPEQYGEVAVQAFRVGVQAFESLDFVTARRSLARATALNANYAPAWLWRAYAEFEFGNAAAAVNAFQQVARLEPANTTFATIQAQATAQVAAQVAAQAAAQAAARAANQTPTNSPTNSLGTPLPTSAQGVPLGDTQLIDVPTLPTGENLVLLDVTYTHNGNFDLETEVSTGTRAFTFFDVPARIPNNLSFPVNYAGGTLYQRLEVRNKPSGFPVQYQHCLLQSSLAFSAGNVSSASACSDANGLTLTAPGIYEHVQPLPSLVRAGAFNWRQPASQQLLIVKDRRGVPVDNRYGFEGAWYASPIFSLYYPMQIRYTAVIVPPGGEFTGWP